MVHTNRIPVDPSDMIQLNQRSPNHDFCASQYLTRKIIQILIRKAMPAVLQIQNMPKQPLPSQNEEKQSNECATESLKNTRGTINQFFKYYCNYLIKTKDNIISKTSIQDTCGAEDKSSKHQCQIC